MHPHLSEPLCTERCSDKGNNTICIATYSTLWRTVVSTYIPSEASCVALSYYLHWVQYRSILLRCMARISSYITIAGTRMETLNILATPWNDPTSSTHSRVCSRRTSLQWRYFAECAGHTLLVSRDIIHNLEFAALSHQEAWPEGLYHLRTQGQAWRMGILGSFHILE